MKVLGSANMRGAALMAASMTGFTVNDTFLKLLGDHLPFFQILFLRGLGVTALMALVGWRTGVFRTRVSKSDRNMILVRTLAEVGAAYFFISALFKMPLANVSAILQALPLTVTLAAALVLREPVGWQRFTAIVIGFFGVFLIVRPDSDGFSIWSIYALLAVVCVTVRDLVVRKMSREVSSYLVALSAAVGVLIFAAVGVMFEEWKPVKSRDLAFLGGSLAFIAAGYLFSVMAMREGEIGFVAPFRYTSLLVALILGVIVFGEWPEALTLVGAGIVVATGLFTLWRERELSRAVAARASAKAPGSTV